MKVIRQLETGTPKRRALSGLYARPLIANIVSSPLLLSVVGELKRIRRNNTSGLIEALDDAKPAGGCGRSLGDAPCCDAGGNQQKKDEKKDSAARAH